jgi:hypothetical protein
MLVSVYQYLITMHDNLSTQLTDVMTAERIVKFQVTTKGGGL